MSDLPLDLVADLDTLPILATASNVTSYNQIPIEQSLVIREIESNQNPRILTDDEVRNLSLDEIHRKIADHFEVPTIFVDKLVAFHMGHFSLSTEDISQYFLYLDKIFQSFADHSSDFQSLSKNDQDALKMANAPLYYHLYLTR